VRTVDQLQAYFRFSGSGIDMFSHVAAWNHGFIAASMANHGRLLSSLLILPDFGERELECKKRCTFSSSDSSASALELGEGAGPNKSGGTVSSVVHAEQAITVGRARRFSTVRTVYALVAAAADLTAAAVACAYLLRNSCLTIGTQHKTPTMRLSGAPVCSPCKPSK